MKLSQSQSYVGRPLPLVWLSQGTLIVFFMHGVFLSANARGVNLDLRCQQLPLDSQCRSSQVAQQSTEPEQKLTKPQVIKFRLNNLAGVAEWIRAEVTGGNQVKLLHTVMSESGVSRALRRFIPIAISHTWYDHPTSRITFQPQGCDKSDCIVTGTDSVILPTGTDIFQGRFTLEYTESGWLRTITFKLPRKLAHSLTGQ
jgi:hypothetical protein